MEELFVDVLAAGLALLFEMLVVRLIRHFLPALATAPSYGVCHQFGGIPRMG